MQYNTTVSTGTLSVQTTTIDYAVETYRYGETIRARGGTGTTTWSVVGGSLPTGIGLSGGRRFCGLSGTPTQVGTFGFTVEVVDSASNTAQRALTLEVHSVSGPLVIVTQDLGRWSTNSSGARPIVVTGGSGSGYIYAIPHGSALPPRLAFSASGTINGTPTQAGIFTFTVEVTDSASNAAQRTYTVEVEDLVACFGIPVRKKAIFMIDASSSMAGSRIATVRAELTQAISNMDQSYEIDCVAFNSDFGVGAAYSSFLWQGLLLLTPSQKNSAINWVNGPVLNPGGGTPTYLCMNYTCAIAPPDLGSLFLITDSTPNTSGFAAQLIIDAPDWWAKFNDCRLECVNVGGGTSTNKFLSALASVLGNAYIAP